MHDQPGKSRRLPHLSLRVKLTLWVVITFTIIEVALSIVFLLYQRSLITELFDERLAARTGTIARALQEAGPDVQPNQLNAHSDQTIGTLMFQDFLLSLYRADGSLVATSGETQINRNQVAFDRALVGMQPVFHRMPATTLSNPAPDARFARTVSQSFTGRDGEQYVLIAAASDAFAQRQLALVGDVLLIAVPIGILASAISAWFIAGIAVSPIRDLRRAASRLTPESIGQEVHLESESSEVLRLEEELEEARQRIERAFRAQERFMSNVAHELKTPIAVLLAEAQTLPVQDARPELRAFVSSVEEEMRKLSRLISSFLMLTRVRAGKSDTPARRISVNDLVMDSVHDCSAWARQHDVQLAPVLLAGEDVIDAEVVGDPELLRTMLNNLVLNAIRFSPKGERVQLSAAAEREDVCIAIRDRGIGIPEEIIDHVFDRFAQADGEQLRGRGHGLGLEIAQGVAELHGGVIRVRNCDDAGCEFRVRIPVADADRPARETP